MKEGYGGTKIPLKFLFRQRFPKFMIIPEHPKTRSSSSAVTGALHSASLILPRSLHRPPLVFQSLSDQYVSFSSCSLQLLSHVFFSFHLIQPSSVCLPLSLVYFSLSLSLHLKNISHQILKHTSCFYIELRLVL